MRCVKLHSQLHITKAQWVCSKAENSTAARMARLKMRHSTSVHIIMTIKTNTCWTCKHRYVCSKLRGVAMAKMSHAMNEIS